MKIRDSCKGEMIVARGEGGLPIMHSGDESSAKLISSVVPVLNGARPPARLEGPENGVSP